MKKSIKYSGPNLRDHKTQPLKAETLARIAAGVEKFLTLPKAVPTNACAFCLLCKTCAAPGAQNRCADWCHCNEIVKGSAVRFKEPYEDEVGKVYAVLEHTHDPRGPVPRVAVSQLTWPVDTSLIGRSWTRRNVDDLEVVNPFDVGGRHFHVRGEQLFEGEKKDCHLCVLDARLLGRDAFRRGVKCVPALDMKNLQPYLAGNQVGDGIPILDAWLTGWSEANVAAPIEPPPHQLIVTSLDDAQLSCTCGGWSLSRTGLMSRAEAEAEFALHAPHVQA